MKPKWQRARAVAGIRKGTIHWVEIGQPFVRSGTGMYDDLPIAAEPHLFTNITGSDGERIGARLNMIELLARDESDFAEDVPLISWEQFLAECRGATGAR